MKPKVETKSLQNLKRFIENMGQDVTGIDIVKAKIKPCKSVIKFVEGCNFLFWNCHIGMNGKTIYSKIIRVVR